MKKFEFKKNLNLPNQLTISRMLIAPVIVVLLHYPTFWMCFLAALLFSLAAVTDLVDGYLARKENQITSLGTFLDPLADKVMIGSVLVVLVALGRIDDWIAIVIICREFMVTGLRAIAAEEGVVLAADQYGKAKTVMQIVALIPLIMHYDWHYDRYYLPMHATGVFLLYIALALTVISGCNYFWNFFKNWQGEPHAGEGKISFEP